MKRLVHVAAAPLLLLLAAAADAQPLPQGWLCCNMRSDGRWISDSNYLESGKFTIPLGTPVKALEYGRYRVVVEVDGQRQTLGNDYSRNIAMPEFARRYVVEQNPAERLKTFPPEVQEVIKSSRVSRGMTREQVLMALGYPMASETPHLDARRWKYWLWTFSPFDVHFGADGRVTDIQTDPDTRAQVVKD
jgi:hypothetical protein